MVKDLFNYQHSNGCGLLVKRVRRGNPVTYGVPGELNWVLWIEIFEIHVTEVIIELVWKDSRQLAKPFTGKLLRGRRKFRLPIVGAVGCFCESP